MLIRIVGAAAVVTAVALAAFAIYSIRVVSRVATFAAASGGFLPVTPQTFMERGNIQGGFLCFSALISLVGVSRCSTAALGASPSWDSLGCWLLHSRG
jgi:hypothetical protein